MKEITNYTELVNQAVNGNNKAFEELYRLTIKSAYRTASFILSNPSDVEDALQNAYIKATEKLSELKSPESFENWLKSIVENECKNYIKKEQRISAPVIFLKRKVEESSEELAEPIPQEIMEREELRNSITDILKSLSPETRACIVLFHYEDKSLNEISEILDIPVGTVKSRLYNGRKKIEKQFAKLRKKDPTLYGIGAIPILLSLLADQAKNITLPASVSSATAAVTVGTAVSTSASTAAGATVTTASVTTGSTAATLSTTAATVATKVTAVVVAGSLAVGGTAIIKNQIEKNTEPSTVSSVKTEETGTVAPSENYCSEIFSEETSIEITTTQSTVSSYANSEAKTTAPLSINNEISVTTQTVTQQTPMATTATTQRSTETTVKPTTSVSETTGLPETTTEITTQIPTETTPPPTTSPENNYVISSGVITEYSGSDSNVSIPSAIGGNTVIAIGSSAFQGNTNISSITLPNTITHIGQEAFADCSSLTSVSLPASLEQIGIGAFYGCSSLSSVNVPNSVTTISDEAFANCTELKTITIPSSVTYISDDAFNGCDSLIIICSEGSAAYDFAVNNSIDYNLKTTL